MLFACPVDNRMTGFYEVMIYRELMFYPHSKTNEVNHFRKVCDYDKKNTPGFYETVEILALLLLSALLRPLKLTNMHV